MGSAARAVSRAFLVAGEAYCLGAERAHGAKFLAREVVELTEEGSAEFAIVREQLELIESAG